MKPHADEKLALLHEDAPRLRSRRSHSLLASLSLITLLTVTAVCWAYEPLSASKHRPLRYRCPQVAPAQLSEHSRALDTPGFRSLVAARLSGAVQIPSVSYDDFAPPGEDARWGPFDDLQAYLSRSFPRLYEVATVEHISTYSLLFVLNGTSAGLRPTMLTGHQDVVPAEDPEGWTYPPFSGHVDDKGWLWGRGAADCKAVAIGILLAVEQLLETGWRPTRPLVLALGQDEEVRGEYGSKHLAARLEELFGRDGIATILDEGGGSLRMAGRDVASIGVSEKGYADMSITVKSPAGHSMNPSANNAISLLAAVVTAYNRATPLVPILTESHPFVQWLTCAATHGDPSLLPKWLTRALRRGDLDALQRGIATSPWAMFQQTTKAPTIFLSGSKVNVIPPSARANFNHRLAMGTSMTDLKRSVSRALVPTIKNLDLKPNESVTIDWHDAEEASPRSRIDSPAWHALSAVERAIFPDVIVAPFLIPGYTDARRYTALSRSIYRHAPSRPGTRLDAHGTDERVELASVVQGVQVYSDFILAMDAITTDDSL